MVRCSMGKIAVLFQGQGAQYIGMGKSLYDEYAIARQTFEEANEILGFDLRKICFEGSVGELNKLENALLANLTVSVANFRVYMQEVGIKPDFAAGHSLGEYSALTCCGAINFADSLKIVQFRGRLAQETVNRDIGGMTIVNNMETNRVEQICKQVSKEGQVVTVSCYNTKDQTAISGHKEAVMNAEGMFLDMGAQVTPLIMSAPFHSSLLQEESEKLGKELLRYHCNDLKWPIISNVTALPYKGKETIIENLKLHLKSPVRWWDTMNYLQEKGVTIYIEMGPQSVLKNFVKVEIGKSTAFTYGLKKDREELVSLLQKQFQTGKVDMEQMTVITKCLAMAVSTKNCNFNEKEYQKGVIEPYEELERIQQCLEKDQEKPSIQQMQEALKILAIILNTKKVPLQEQTKLFRRVLHETCTGELLSDFLEKEMRLGDNQFIKFKA